MCSKGYISYNYLDDFIIIDSSYDKTIKAQNFLIFTLRKLGFYISWSKITSPTQYCRFLGIDIDSLEGKLYLPQEKITKFRRELMFWQNKRTSTKLQMQRLCGILNFCCKVIRGGRVYMYHMIQLLKLFNNSRRITLPSSFHDDLSWWNTFAEKFNGCADFFDPVDNSIDLYTDACLRGLAAVCNGDFYQAKVTSHSCDDVYYYATSDNSYSVLVPEEHVGNINVLELIAVLLSIDRWKSFFNNTRIVAHCDNLQVCYNLAKDKTRNNLANTCLRHIFWLCVDINAYISPVYLPSYYNVDADYLSRCVNF